jgi:hypothetical protein
VRILKTFKEYLAEGIAKSIRPDHQRAKSLCQESERKMRSLQENLKKVGISVDNANDYVEYCYDTLMLLIRAKLYQEGFTTGGHGAHEAEVAYLRTLGTEEKDIRYLDQLRYFRNGILYYGKTLDPEYAEQVIDFTKNMHPLLLRQLGDEQ